MVTETRPLPHATNDIDAPRASSNDRFTVRPIWIAVILLSLLFPSAYAANNLQRYEITAPILVLITFVTVFVDLLLLFTRLAMGHWRASISVAVALFLFVGCFFGRSEILLGIDYVRFRMFRNYYISALTTVSGPKVMPWGFRTYFIDGPVYRQLVYDELDEVGSMDGKLSPRVRKAIQDTIDSSLSRCGIRAHRLEGHFYIVDLGCP